MKTKIFTLLVCSILASCSKDNNADQTFYLEEYYFNDYITTTGFNQEVVTRINSDTYEFGSEFTPLVDGKITKIAVNLPQANPILRITIWDKISQSPIKTEIVNYTEVNNTQIFDLTDILLQKNKEYAITMNNNDWVERSKTNGETVNYPIIIGNIKVTGYKFITGTLQVYPNSSNQTHYYAGDLSFYFLQTE